MSRISLIGGGGWGTKLHEMLSKDNLLADWPDLPRRKPDEGVEHYKDRVWSVLRKSRGDVAWLAVPPADQAILVDVAVECGFHVIVEKPWLAAEDMTKVLIEKSRANSLATGVPYIYCFLDRLVSYARYRPQAWGMEGVFKVAVKNRLNLGALENLGSHILAIRRYVCPDAELLSLEVEYDAENTRCVKLHYDKSVDYIDFSNNKEPIVQRFVASFLNGVDHGDAFMFDLDFASKVSADMEKIKCGDMKNLGCL